MPDLIRTPGEIKTMVESVFMASLQESGLSIDLSRITWFRTLLVMELEQEIFKLLCEEENRAVKKHLRTNREFLEGQITLWKNLREEKSYNKADIIRDWFKRMLNIELN